MTIIGCDSYPAFQPIAFVDTDTGKLQEQRLQHREEAEKFYRNLAARGDASVLGKMNRDREHYEEGTRMIKSAPRIANVASSFDDSPLTATAPATSPSFQTGMPPPHPTNFGSP
jgi:hypothetical protein